MKLASKLSKYIQVGDILSIDGELGSGKTTFVRYLVAAFGGDVTTVHSPTYTLLHSYDADIPIIHIDAYRLHGLGDLESLGFSEYCESSVSCIEWANRLGKISEPEQLWKLEFKHDVNNTRSADIESPIGRALLLENLI